MLRLVETLPCLARGGGFNVSDIIAPNSNPLTCHRLSRPYTGVTSIWDDWIYVEIDNSSTGAVST